MEAKQGGFIAARFGYLNFPVLTAAANGREKDCILRRFNALFHPRTRVCIPYDVCARLSLDDTDTRLSVFLGKARQNSSNLTSCARPRFLSASDQCINLRILLSLTRPATYARLLSDSLISGQCDGWRWRFFPGSRFTSSRTSIKRS